MNKIFIPILCFLSILFTQNITNKLGGDDATVSYNITDSNDNELLKVQGDGKIFIGMSTALGVLNVDGGANGNAVFGQSQFGSGIYGYAHGSTGTNYGGYFEASGSTGIGVKGVAGPTGANFGGHFSSSAMEGTGVYGEAHKYGGHFKSTAFPTGVGIYAEGSGAAGLFSGKVGIGTTTPDANLDVHGTVKVLGTWAIDAYWPDVVYQASTDGFIVARITKNIDWSWVKIEGFSDSSNPPTTRIAYEFISNLLNTGGSTSITFPVKKGDYFLITDGNDGNNTQDFRINWIPLGQ